MYDNKFETKENEIWTKDIIKPQHIQRKEALAWVEGGTVFVGTVAFWQPLWQSIWNENRRFNAHVIYYHSAFLDADVWCGLPLESSSG